MRGCLKPLYLPTGRKGITSLSPSSAHRTLRVDGHSYGWIVRNKSCLGQQPNLGRAKYRRTNAVIYSGNTPGCKRSAHRRTRDGRTQVPASKASILRIHCPHSMQITVPTLSKYSIRGLHGIPEITTLLSRVFNYGGLGSTTQRHNK